MKVQYLFAILFFSASLFAQDDKDSDMMKDTMMQKENKRQLKVSFDVHEASLNDLNTELLRAGIAPVGDFGYGAAVSMPFFKNSECKSLYLEISLSGYYREHNNAPSIPKVASIIGAGTQFDLLFPVVKSKWFEVEPFIGVGLDYYTISVADRVGRNSIANIPSDYNEYNISSFTLSGKGGLQIGIRLPAGFTIGARGGFFATVPNNWRLSSSKILDDTIDLSSLFAGSYIKYAF
jgi:hypothetical protein